MTAEFSVLGEKDNFLAIEKKYSAFSNSKIAILQAPYEKTTSYGKGTSKGPAAILKASHYVEFFDEETEKEICFSEGITSLKPLNFGRFTSKKMLDVLYKNVKALIDAGKFVITLGGEHSISTAPIKAYFDSYKDLSILHFDAHSDLRNEYEGSKFSHACFAARVAEFTNKITQVGIRAQCKEEFDFIKSSSISTFYAHEIHNEKFSEEIMDIMISTLDMNVYITFDVDYFDPSIMPSTGTPEPNGFYWHQTTKFLRRVCDERNVVGFDVVELAPRKDFNFPDFLTAKLVYKILNYKF
jgi:N1-aminopropylagmatine ureohydrolase